MKRSILVMMFSILVSVGITRAARAEEESGSSTADPARLGPYVAVAAAYDWATNFEDDHGQAGGLNTRLGFRFWKYMSAEAVYEWGNKDPDDAWTVGGNLKGYPLTGNLQPFILLGASYWELGDLANDVGIRFGAGLDGYVSDHFYLSGGFDYVWGLGDLSDFNFATLYAGVGYRL